MTTEKESGSVEGRVKENPWAFAAIFFCFCLAVLGLTRPLVFIDKPAESAERDPKQARAFRKDHPCPATGKTSGACPGWVIDHIKPLCFGGKDEPGNMAWQEKRVSFIKDGFEREACGMKKKCSTVAGGTT